MAMMRRLLILSRIMMAVMTVLPLGGRGAGGAFGAFMFVLARGGGTERNIQLRRRPRRAGVAV